MNGGDAEVLVAEGETSSGGGDAGFGVPGDGGVAIEDEVAVGSDAGGVDLGHGKLGCGEACEKERKDGGVLQKVTDCSRCYRNTKNWGMKN